MIIGAEEHGAGVAHDSVDPAFVTDDFQPVIAKTAADAQHRHVFALEDVGSGQDARGQFALLLEMLVGHHLFCVRQILDGGHTAFAGFGQDRTNSHQPLFKRHGWNDVFDQCHCSAAQNAGQPPFGRAFDLATGGLDRCFIDSGKFQRQRVGQIHAAVEAADQHRMLRGNGVDEGPVGSERTIARPLACALATGTCLPLLVGAPGTADDPTACGQPLGCTFYPFGEGNRLVDVQQIDTGDEHTGGIHVHMGIVEPGADECAGEVDHPGGGSPVLENHGVAADGDDS